MKSLEAKEKTFPGLLADGTSKCKKLMALANEKIDFNLHIIPQDQRIYIKLILLIKTEIQQGLPGQSLNILRLKFPHHSQLHNLKNKGIGMKEHNLAETVAMSLLLHN